MKQAGILMSISSLPSNYGIGDFGSNAYQFVDYINKAQLKIWQILPFNRLGYGNSPYQCYSSVAGDEIFISLDNLMEIGLLDNDKITSFNENSNQVNYEAVRVFKDKLLRSAYEKFKARQNDFQLELDQFINENDWVYNYAVFVTLKAYNNQKSWLEWPVAQKEWIKNKKYNLDNHLEDINYYIFLQYIFYKQWYALKSYANERKIEIMGDIPYYVGIDSLDVWSNQDLFLLDIDSNPTFIAGVPPDYFAKTGQRWGNPIYDWDMIAQKDYQFWINRLRLNIKAFDIIRIDHFRAFDTYWKIPSSCETAMVGEWVEAPGYAFFDKLYQEIPDIKLIAEDLGEMRPEVFELRDHYHLAGMKIIQFTFDPNENNNDFEDRENMIIYTGTHDNQTIIGWFNTQEEDIQEEIINYLSKLGYNGEFNDMMINFAVDSIAKLVIIPTQDLIGLDDEARMNVPGSIGSPNWEWKLSNYDALPNALDKYNKMLVKAKRLNI